MNDDGARVRGCGTRSGFPPPWCAFTSDERQEQWLSVVFSPTGVAGRAAAPPGDVVK